MTGLLCARYEGKTCQYEQHAAYAGFNIRCGSVGEVDPQLVQLEGRELLEMFENTVANVGLDDERQLANASEVLRGLERCRKLDLVGELRSVLGAHVLDEKPCLEVALGLGFLFGLTAP